MSTVLKKIISMKKKKLKKTGIVIASLLILLLAFTGLDRDEKLFQIDKNLDIYYTLVKELNTFYVDDINPTDLVTTSIDDMLASLDPYTTYIPESEIEDFRFMTTGEYAGIGAVISQHDDQIIISEPYEGFPAQKAGLKAGDIILEVSGKSTENMTTEDVSSLLKGQANQPVVVKIQRPGDKKSIDFTIVRDNIQIDAVSYYGMLDDKTGYIQLTQFTEGCSNEVKKALLELKNQDGAQSIVLDLRSNPGGLLNEAVNVVNLFVPKGQEVVSTKGKLTQNDKIYRATANPVDTIIPLAVLVNSNSASASEIVSGALQDLDRAVIIGTRTFGKGLVQTTRDLTYNTKLKVTTAKYYIPSGRCIQALDYSHRNPDGSVGAIPDSLISEFTTKKGRKVYDGGGIVPDIKMDQNYVSTLSINLLNKFMIFDFATQYANQNPTIPSPEDFQITDEIFNEFKAFLKEKGFTYNSETQSKFNELLEVAKEEKYYDIAQDEFNDLEAKIGHELNRDLDQFRDEIGELLTSEIVSRYYYQTGTIQAELKTDKSIDKALEIVNSPDEFSNVFKPGKIIS